MPTKAEEEEQRRSELREIALELLRADPEAQRVLVFEERAEVHPELPSGRRSALIVKVASRGPRRKDPSIFGFPPIEERQYPIGITKVHPSLVEGNTIRFDSGGAWGGVPIVDETR